MHHGGAKTVRIAASMRGGGGFEIVVSNDGEPFDEASAPGSESGHYGLAGMRERANRSDLKLTIDGKNRRVTICCQGKR